MINLPTKSVGEKAWTSWTINCWGPLTIMHWNMLPYSSSLLTSKLPWSWWTTVKALDFWLPADWEDFWGRSPLVSAEELGLEVVVMGHDASPFQCPLLPACCAMGIGLLLCNGGCSLWTLRFLRRELPSQRHSSKFLSCHGENVAKLSKVQALYVIVVVCRLIQIVAFVVVKLLVSKVIIIFIAFADWLHRLTCIVSTCNIDSGSLRPTFPTRIHSGCRARRRSSSCHSVSIFPFPRSFLSLDRRGATKIWILQN